MDPIDRKILKVLQQDARASLQQIGQAVGLSASPCWERIKKMEAEVEKFIAEIEDEIILLSKSKLIDLDPTLETKLRESLGDA